MLKVAVFGAAGKMGSRISHKLKDDPECEMFYVEAGERGEARLREQGLEPSNKYDAARQADIVILAVPDTAIGVVANDIVPKLKSGSMVICLDPAAPLAGELPERSDISYFVVHPCHPPVINDEIDPEAKRDFFGGNKAKQNIVCALMQGPEEDYLKGEQISRKMFAPVMNAHRLTVEQMALLEPAMAETVALTCMTVIREAMDEAVSRGVPYEAARDFILGHLNVNIAILFGFTDIQVSDSAKLAVQRAKESLFQKDWKKIFEKDNVLNEVKSIVKGGK